MQKRVIELEAKTDKLEKNLNDVSKQLDGINESVQSTADGFVDATKDSKKLNDSVEKTEGSTKNATQGFKKMGVALKAVGIGLLIAALGTLKELFQSNQRVVDIFNTAFQTLSIIFSDFVNFVNNNFGAIAKSFKEVFQNPIQSIKDFGNAIVDGLINRFNQLKETIGIFGQSLSALFAGDFTKAFELVKKAQVEAVDVITGVDDSVAKIKETFNEVKESVSGYVTETIKAAKSNVELAKSAEIAAAVNQGLIEQFDRQAEQQRQIRDDEFKTIEERIEANNKLKDVLDEQEKAMLNNVNIQIKQAQTAFNLNKTQENAIALIEAKNEKLAVEAQIEGFRSEQLVNKTALEKELIELNQTSIDGTNQRTIAERKAADELIEDNAKRIQAQIDTLEEEIRIETERLERKRQFFKEGTQARKDADEELLNFISESNIQKKALDNDLTKTELENSKLLKEAKIKNQQDLVSATSTALGSLVTLAGEGTKVGKAAALAQILIDTASGISSAIAGATAAAAATGPAAPVVTPILIAQLVGQVLAGVASAKAILSKVEGPTPNIPTNVSTGGAGGGTGIGSQAPAFNVVGQSGFNQVAQALGQQNSTPIKAFVVSGDVTSAQALENNIIDTATF
tara:strand:- start:9 stop:1892 length:1884 start_codon:yes stop_codon:yes gene_type:complete